MTTPKPPSGMNPDLPQEAGDELADFVTSERPLETSASIPAIDVAAELGGLEFDPDDVLASLVPYDEPSSVVEQDNPPISFDNEKPGRSYLEDLGLIEEFRNIADRLSSEYTSTIDATAQSELAIIQSELLAITGDTEGALSHATRSAAELPASRLARVQARHLTLESGNLDEVPSLVDSELASLNDTKSKTQLRLWQSEFLRLVLNDKLASEEALSVAMQETPSDSQVNLLRLLNSLAIRDTSYLDWLNTSPFPIVDSDSIRTLARIRGDIGDHDPSIEHSAAVILDVADVLMRGNLSEAARWLSSLRALPNCELSIRWLLACLMAANDNTRRGAIDELLKLEQLEYDPEVQRTLLERAIEVGDFELVNRLLQSVSSDDDRAISQADELVLSVLAGAAPATIRELCRSVGSDASLAPLAAAVLDMTSQSTDSIVGFDRQTQAELILAQWLANVSPTAEFKLPQLDPATDDSVELAALKFALGLEVARENDDWCGLARLFQEANPDSGPWLAGDREALAALCFQAGGDSASANAAWQRARAERTSCEAAVRAALEVSEGNHKRSILEQYADQLDLHDERAPWLLLEAALLASGESNDEAQRLLEQAHAISPDIALTLSIGHDLARNAGNAKVAADWLNKRAELASDATESAMLAAQEALLLKDEDSMSAESCALRAMEYAPNDATLRVLRSQLAPSSRSGEWQSNHELEHTDPLGMERICQTAARAAWLGDWRVANDAAIALAELEAPTVATLWAEQAVASGQRYPKLFERLFAKARTETDPLVQRELYERLSRLDPNAGSTGNADLWLNAIIERDPGNLAALRSLERSVIRRGQWQELASISEKLVQQLDRSEAVGYSWLSSTLHTYSGNWEKGQQVVEWAARQDPAPMWSLRRQLAFALAKGHWETVHSVQIKLAERISYAGDATILAIRRAESARQLEQWDTALASLKVALDLSPDHVVALSLWAAWQLQRGDIAAAADGFEQLAQACAEASHREASLSRAAELWLSVGDDSRAEFALEQLLTSNPNNSSASVRLTRIYRSSNSYDRLAALIERQLEYTQDPLERSHLQVERARCLLALDLTIAADKALEPALHAFPDNIDALEVKADIALAVDDRHEAEFTYTRLLKLVTDPGKQAELYRKLGTLYERSPDKLDAAESAYDRLLELLPSDSGATAAKVRLCLSRGNTADAIRLQTQLVELAEESLDQRQRLIELSRIHETAALDRRRAEEILEKARRKWQNDSIVLKAFAEFYQRMADGAALQVLLDRSAAEARRALHTGRFEVAFFEILATVASLRDQAESSQVADAMVSALRGEASDLPGVGLLAVNSRFDEVLAPELLNLPLRAMLQRTGWAMDAALPLDLKPLRVVPLKDTNTAQLGRFQELADAFDLCELSILVSPVAGHACIPVQSRPPVLVLSQQLLELKSESTRDFLLVRAMKILQTHTACLSRAAPVDLWPLLAAYLGQFLPNWQPTGVDNKRLEDAKHNMRSVLADGYTHDMAALAQDVVVALGNRASQIGEAVNEWGSRTALLALGDPSSALDALQLATASSPLPREASLERVKWVNRHAEARNLAIFFVSDSFMQLREQLLRS
jgi:tetratricopeptide (TPR) repeat protein